METPETDKQIELLKLQIELLNLQKENEDEVKNKRKRTLEQQRTATHKWLSKNPDYHKIYQAKNHDKLVEYRRTKLLVKEKCPFCEKEITHVNLARHIRQKHENMDYVFANIKSLLE
jgi:hypothetical protein